MKQKPIKVLEVWPFDGEAYYRINASDVRAIAEEFVDSSSRFFKLPPMEGEDRQRSIAAALYALKRIGITPARKNKAITP
jgi:hypothetical protein